MAIARYFPVQKYCSNFVPESTRYTVDQLLKKRQELIDLVEHEKQTNNWDYAIWIQSEKAERYINRIDWEVYKRTGDFPIFMGKDA